MRLLLKAVIALVVVAAVALVAVDIASRTAIQHQLEGRIDGYVPGARASVTIHAFPFLLPLAAKGRVARITAHAGPVHEGTFVFDRVDVTVTGARINRHLYLHHRQLEIVAIDSGTVTADMTQADFSRLVGMAVTFGAGTAQVTTGGATVSGRVSVGSGQLVFESTGAPTSVPIPQSPVLPCLADVRIVPGHLIGSCTFHQIPAALKIALQTGAVPAG